MRGPFARVVGAIAVLWLFHTVLLRDALSEDLSPGSPAIERSLVASRDAYAAGRFEEALEPTLKLVAALPGQDVFLMRLAYIYRELERPDDEARTWEAVVDVSPTPVDACPMLAEVYQRMGDERASLHAYERCVGFDPKNLDMLLYLAQAYFRADRRDDAREVLERGIGFSGGYADYSLVLGVIEYSEGHTARARERFEHFVELAPDRREEVAVWLQRTASRP